MRKKMIVIEFTKVKLPYGWLGNMFGSDINYDGKIWKTSEALFQALRFEDEEIREMIRNEQSPMSAKMKSKRFKHKMVVVPMSEEDVKNMKMVVKLKFDQNSDLRSELKKTGDHILIENIGERKGGRHLFWGMKKVNGEWIGNNVTGKILMEVRNEYLKADKIKSS